MRNDPRYAFMFENANVGGDTMAEVLSQLFRLPANGKPMTIMQLAGFPSEVVDAVVSVLCRMAFDFGLWSDGAIPLLFVCEEAHRYASVRPQDRLRPDPPRDLAHRQGRPQVRRLPRPRDAAAGRARSDHHLPVQHAVRHAHGERPRPGACSLGGVGRGREPARRSCRRSATREVFAFGEGVALPTRLKFKELPAHLRPKGERIGEPATPAMPSRRTSSRPSSSAGAAPP